MKAEKNWIAAIVLVPIAVVTGYVTRVAGKAEQPTETTPQFKFVTNQRDVLAGLQGVYVGVEEIGPEVEKYSLTKQVLQTDVELRLRQCGVRVLSQEEFRQTVGRSILYINITPAINEKFDLAAVTIQVELNELAFLVRGPTTCVRCATWVNGSTMVVGKARINEVRDKVKEFVDMFINDYLAANPKARPADQETEKPKGEPRQ